MEASNRYPVATPGSIRLSELSARVSRAIEEAFSYTSFWVIADVTNHTYKSQKDYHYFELVEKAEGTSVLLAKFSGSAWGTGSQKIAEFEKATGQRFTGGLNVLVKVTVKYQAAYGLQLTLQDIDINFTLGVLEQQRQATLLRLVRDNPEHIRIEDGRLKTSNQGLVLNRVIQRIAVISSSTSAGFQDFQHTLENNGWGYRFSVDPYFALIQGDHNAGQLVDKIVAVYQSGVAYDALVIIRGGGAQTDFLIFDHYAIARAIARFPIPVITGIGHQKNETLTDLAAHTATKTPTKAAEFIIAHNRGFEQELLQLQKNMVIKSQQLLSAENRKLSMIRTSLVNNTRSMITGHKDALVRNNQITINTTKSILYRHRTGLNNLYSKLSIQPKGMLYKHQAELSIICRNLKTFSNLYSKSQENKLSHYASLIKLMSPENILSKGFAIVKAKGKIRGNADGINLGEEITVILAKQQLVATVTSKENHDGTEFNI
ncbi:exodeoxyribonuclease VII large subunit [Mucilaginibacter arboris]|uniref:Exodeoxyribonuclease 7 large subunit n=1 Tax=Mucilaginibacter arboris TaxID=2682090 RepID=A0A7K1T0A0_9SPHI|nr:exodeoxyribonuclease VII large subunit [Mucilaginibacter arboris]MVN23001.1 exodeoxyribonuclease VII large subunit [Mucilaginibacter arboris]